MALFRQFTACQAWQAPACLRSPHRNLLEILSIFSPAEFCRSRFSSDRGKTTANPDGFARISTKSGRKYARQNRVRICSRLAHIIIVLIPLQYTIYSMRLCFLARKKANFAWKNKLIIDRKSYPFLTYRSIVAVTPYPPPTGSRNNTALGGKIVNEKNIR